MTRNVLLALVFLALLLLALGGAVRELVRGRRPILLGRPALSPA